MNPVIKQGPTFVASGKQLYNQIEQANGSKVHVKALKTTNKLLNFFGILLFIGGMLTLVVGLGTNGFEYLQNAYYEYSGGADIFSEEGFNYYGVVMGTTKRESQIKFAQQAAEVKNIGKTTTTPTQTPGKTTKPTPTATPIPTPTLPPFNPDLSKNNRVKIPSIGVDSNIIEGADSKKALYKGIWRDPGAGDPERFDIPMVLAAHRYGYIEWSEAFKKSSSFRYLDGVKVGDTVEIIWNQRLYKYKILKIIEADQIYASDADLVLYTCKHLNSPIRIVVYAERI